MYQRINKKQDSKFPAAVVQAKHTSFRILDNRESSAQSITSKTVQLKNNFLADNRSTAIIQQKRKGKKKKGPKGKTMSLQEFYKEYGAPEEEEPVNTHPLDTESEEPEHDESHYEAEDSYDDYPEPSVRTKRRSKKHHYGVERYDMIKHVGKGRVPRNKDKSIDIQSVSNAEAFRLKRAQDRDIRLVDHSLPSDKDGHGMGQLNDHIKLAPSIVSVAYARTGKKHHLGIGKSKDRNPTTLATTKEHRRGIARVNKNKINTIVDENWETTRCGEHEAMSSMQTHRKKSLKGYRRKNNVPFSQISMTATRVHKLSTTPPCSRCGDVFCGTKASPARVTDLYDTSLSKKDRKKAYKQGVSLAETDKGILHTKGKVKRKNKTHKQNAKEKRRQRFSFDEHEMTTAQEQEQEQDQTQEQEHAQEDEQHEE